MVVQKERLRPTGVVNTGNNVSGNKGIRLGKRYNVVMGKGKKYLTKQKIKHGASFAKYGGPTVSLFKKTGAAAMGTGKFLLKRGALGIPGLVATGAYYGAKHAIKKGERVYKRTPFKQFDKKGRWMI